MHETQSAYTIMEIKPKLTTPVHNVTLVVATVYGMIIGELQLKIEQNDKQSYVAFKKHIIYELERMHETPWIFRGRSN